jgi:preprotein translocase subunit SecB
MKVTLSELELIDFAVIKTTYELVSPENTENTFSADIFNLYDLELDYETDLLDNQLRVFMDISVNCGDKQLEGYSFMVASVGIFKFKENNELTAEYIAKTGLVSSAVAITINNIRSYIMILSSCCPFGKYVLPAIDLGVLLTKKAEQINKNIHSETAEIKKVN